MQINYSHELKKAIAQYNKTRSAKDFDKMIPSLVNAKLLFSVGVQGVTAEGNVLGQQAAEFVGAFLRSHDDKTGKSFLVAFTDEGELKKGPDVSALSLKLNNYCKFLEASNADGIIINPFSQESSFFLAREMIVNDILPALKQAEALRSAQNGTDDNSLMYQGYHIMEFGTLPSEFFTDSDEFIKSLSEDKAKFIEKHLMISQLLACRELDKKQMLTDENLAKQRADRVMIAKGQKYDPELYYFTAVSEQAPFMYILDFPPSIQIPVLCKRMYFVIGENGKKAIYTIEVSYDGKQNFSRITDDKAKKNLGVFGSADAFEETKQILEDFTNL